MVSRSRFGRGDIVMVNLDPTEGHEQKGMRPALVLSTSAFNALGVGVLAGAMGDAIPALLKP